MLEKLIWKYTNKLRTVQLVVSSTEPFTSYGDCVRDQEQLLIEIIDDLKAVSAAGE